MPQDPDAEASRRRAATARRLLVAGGSCYAIYFALLINCDIRRPEQTGLALDFSEGNAAVVSVAPASPAERAGLLAGDRLLQAGATRLRTRADWFAFDSRLEFGRAFPVRLRRGAVEREAAFEVRRADATFWRTRGGIVLAVLRVAQLAMLVLSFAIVSKRPDDFAARVGAWLLASLSAFCIALPARFAAVWATMPGPIGAALWLPYASSTAGGAVIATFLTVFPHRAPGWRPVVMLIWAAAAPALAMNVYDRAHIVYGLGEERFTAWAWTITPMNLVLVAGGVVVMIANYRRLAASGERRRVRLVLAATGIGCTSAGCLRAVTHTQRNFQVSPA